MKNKITLINILYYTNYVILNFSNIFSSGIVTTCTPLNDAKVDDISLWSGSETEIR